MPPVERKQSGDYNRKKFSPPDVMADSLYSVVDKDKSKRYPAPKVPPPPPPYEGNAMKEGDPSIKGASEVTLNDDNVEKPGRSMSPPGYESVAAGSAKTLSGGTRLPPSRPSRPPAGTGTVSAVVCCGVLCCSLTTCLFLMQLLPHPPLLAGNHPQGCEHAVPLWVPTPLWQPKQGARKPKGQFGGWFRYSTFI